MTGVTFRGRIPILVLVLAAAAAAAVLLFRSVGADGAEGRPPSAPESARGQASSAPAPDAAPSLQVVPFVDSARAGESVEDAADDADGSGRLVIEVVHHDGTPAGDAFVLLFREDKVLRSGTTDPRGRVHLPPGGGEASAYVDATSCASIGRIASLGEGLRRIVLPAGIPMWGRVLVDGREPGTPVALEISRDAPDPAVQELPPAVRHRILESGAWRDRGVETGPGGVFVSPGFVPGWSGRIFVPGYRIAASDEAGPAGVRLPSVPVTDPSQRLRISLASLPRIRGRVVSPADPDSQTRLWISWEVRTQAGGSSWSQLTTDASGRFELPLDFGPIEAVTFEFPSTPDLDGPISARAVVLGPIDSDVMIEDVTIGPPRAVAIDVRGARGEAVSGAVAGYSGIQGVEERTAPSDAAGRLTVQLPAGACRVRIEEPSHVPLMLDVPADAIGPLCAVLMPATSVGVEVVLRDGAPLQGFRVRVRSAQPSPRLFVDTDPWSPDAKRYSWKDGERETFRCELEKRKAVLRGLLPGVPLLLEVFTASGSLVGSKDVCLAPGEAREITLHAAAERRTFRGRVTDGAGSPIPAATVRFDAGAGSMPDDAWAGEDGRFEIRDVLAMRGRLEVRAAGFVPLLRTEYELPPDSAVQDFALARGRSLKVIVVDAGGDRFGRSWVFDEDALPVWIETTTHPGMRWPALTTRGRRGWSSVSGSGVYTFKGLPDSEIRLRVEDRPGCVHEFHHDPAIPEARVILPLHGSVRASWDFLILDDTELRLRIWDPRGTPTEPIIGGAPARTYAFVPRVPPGTWSVVLERGDGPNRWRPDRWIAMTKPVSVSVQPGMTSVVHLPRP